MITMLRNNYKKETGFTLLEILIAVFIFATIISILYTSYTGTLRNIKETEYQVAIYQMARITLVRMVEDLESAYISPFAGVSPSEENSPLETGFSGENIEIEGKYADSLDFTSRGHIVLTEEDETVASARISYYIKEADDGDSFILYRSDVPDFDEQPETGTGGLIICDRLHSIDFTFHDDKGEVYESWNSSADDTLGRLPSMVQIRLEFSNRSNPESPLRFMTGVMLPMASTGSGTAPKSHKTS